MLGSPLGGNSDGVLIMNVQRQGQRPATGLFYGLRGAITLNPAVTHSLPADFAAPKTADVG